MVHLSFQQAVPNLRKQRITTLQINLGKKCNQACRHCHVEAGPQRTEELSAVVCEQVIELMRRFPQVETIDLTGGAPEMNAGFRTLVAAARSLGKAVIVRSNLTIFEVPGYADLPDYFAANQVRVVASLPCYLADNVDQMRGSGVFAASIRGLQALNQRGYGHDRQLILDLVYNPPLPSAPEQFRLPPEQQRLTAAYHEHLLTQFGITFNHLLTITNMPIGRTRQFLQHQSQHPNLDRRYTQFLADHFNPETVAGLMCRSHLSIDYLGNVYDCDFNQMEGMVSRDAQGLPLTVARLLELNTLEAIDKIQTADFCYGCTAGCGSSCGGSLTSA